MGGRGFRFRAARGMCLYVRFGVRADMKHALGFVINFALVSASSNHESTRQGNHCAAGKGGGGCGVAAPYEEDGKKQYQDDADEAVQLPAPVEGLVLPYGFVPDGLFFSAIAIMRSAPLLIMSLYCAKSDGGGNGPEWKHRAIIICTYSSDRICSTSSGDLTTVSTACRALSCAFSVICALSLWRVENRRRCF